MTDAFLVLFAQSVGKMITLMRDTVIVRLGDPFDPVRLTLWDVALTCAFWGIILEAIELCIKPVGGGYEDD